MVKARFQDYVDAEEGQKTEVAKKIVKDIGELGGTFLKLDENGKTLVVEEKVAVEKTIQCLRDQKVGIVSDPCVYILRHNCVFKADWVILSFSIYRMKRSFLADTMIMTLFLEGETELLTIREIRPIVIWSRSG